MVVPDGNYLAATLTIATDGQKLLGIGGRISALPATLHSDDFMLVNVEANFVEVAGLYLDNPTLQNRKEAGWPDSINTGIAIRGFQVNVHHNTVRRFRDGIRVTSSAGFFSGFEHAHNIIANNIVRELLGSGSGSDEKIGNQGESAGDGITNRGAIAIITGNIVHAREGADCRIGIHTESLGDRYDPNNPGTLYPDLGTVISNNFVLGHDLDARNGRFRRGIVSEGVENTSIVGNVIFGGGWWAIAVITGGSDPLGRGNFSILGNNISWRRPAVDLAGDEWNPARAGIAVFANTRGRLANVSIADNNVEVLGEIATGIRVDAFTLTTFRGQIQITGNSVLQQGGVFTNSLFNASEPGGQELILANNTFKGHIVGGQALVRVQNTIEHLVIDGNIVVFEGGPTGVFKCMEISGGSGVVTGNHFDGANDGVHLINMPRVVFSGNIVENCANNGVNMFGTVSAILSNNIIEAVGNQHITNYTSSPIKLDENNVKS